MQRRHFLHFFNGPTLDKIVRGLEQSIVTQFDGIRFQSVMQHEIRIERVEQKLERQLSHLLQEKLFLWIQTSRVEERSPRIKTLKTIRTVGCLTFPVTNLTSVYYSEYVAE